jgi:hypothetical protein
MPKNFCLEGKDINTLSDKEYLKAFAKGPCSPTLVLPGLLSTKLSVKIDCLELKSQNPRVFKQCGWNACTKHYYEVFLFFLLIKRFGKMFPKKSICFGFPI